MSIALAYRTALRALVLLWTLAGQSGPPQVPPPSPPDVVLVGSYDGPVHLERRLRILFVGNSYTHRGPVPALVRELAVAGGWPAPEVRQVAPGGKDLAFHRRSPETRAAVAEGDWDVVVLQEHSTRPTASGNPTGFARDVRWFARRVARTSPGSRLVLFETWARHPDHALCRTRFDGPRDMQAQLRRHYTQAAEDVGATVAPVGDVWEATLAEDPDTALHDDDLHHAAPAGQLLAAMVLFEALYETVAPKIEVAGVSASDVERLREHARSAGWRGRFAVDTSAGLNQEFVWSLSTATPLASSSSSPEPSAPSTDGASTVAASSPRRSRER